MSSDLHALTDTSAALIHLVEVLAERARRSVSRRDVRRSVVDALHQGPSGDWVAIVTAAATSLGLVVRGVEAAPAELASLLDKQSLPLATLRADDRRSPVLIESLRPSDVAMAVRIDPREPWPFLLAEPTTSLDVMRSAGSQDGDARPPSPARRLIGLLRLERDDLWIALTYAAAVGLLSLATPIGVQTLVNTVAFSTLIQPLIVLTVLVLAGLSFAAVLRALQAWVVERVQQRVFVRVALDLSHRLPRVELPMLRKTYGPELVNRFFDVVTIQKGAAALLIDGLSLALQTVVGMLILSFYHPFLLGFAVLLVATIVVVLLLGRGATASALKESKSKYAVAAWLEELATHELAFRSTSGALLAVERAEELTKEWLKARRKHFSALFRQIGGALALQVFASATLLGIGGWLVIERQLTLGQLVAAELIVTTVVAGFTKLGKHFESYYDLVAALDKLGQLIDLPLERQRGLRLVDDTPVHLELRGASAEALATVNWDVASGAKVGVVAEDDHTARCLVDVVSGLAPATGGIVEVDGRDLREISPTALREVVAIVRGPEIFPGTIAENVSLRRVERAGELNQAISRALAADVVERLGGVDFELGTHGRVLGPTEVIRLTLARALARNPRLLIIDGALDALPPSMRDGITAQLMDASFTLIVVTRDPQFVGHFERVYVARDGQLTKITQSRKGQ